MTNPFAEEVEVPEVQEVDNDVVVNDEVDTPAETAATEEKPKKAKKESSRPAVPEGYMTPVQFAKVLTEHLAAQGASNKNGPIGAENPIAPQMVYSYIKNAGSGENRFPTYSEGGRDNLLKLNDEGVPQEGLDWWDAKTNRVAQRTANAQAKAAKKAQKAEASETSTETVEVEEAE